MQYCVSPERVISMLILETRTYATLPLPPPQLCQSYGVLLSCKKVRSYYDLVNDSICVNALTLFEEMGKIWGNMHRQAELILDRGLGAKHFLTPENGGGGEKILPAKLGVGADTLFTETYKFWIENRVIKTFLVTWWKLTVIFWS